MENWYEQFYGDNPEAENPHGKSILTLTPQPEMQAFLAAGGRLTDYLKMIRGHEMFITDKNLMSPAEPVVEAKVFTLESLIAWLETKDPDEFYCFVEKGDCLVAQWAGLKDLKSFEIDEATFDGCLDIAANFPHTFGHALSRANRLTRARAALGAA